jgi:pentose-5-phosphate-3-epimerase
VSDDGHDTANGSQMIRGATGASPERFGPTDGAALVSQGDVDCGTHAVSVTGGSGRLALWHRNFPGLIAGSIHEVAPTDRPALARLLSAQGLTVHVHATGDDGDIAGLWTAVAATHPAPIDVHVIGSEAFVDDMLPAVLAARPGRVFLPFSTFTDRRAAVIRGADVRAWITVWDEWDDTSAPRWPADPDGVLVILTEPGTTDRCRGAQQVKVAAECASQFPALPVMVEGSITESFAPVCAAAGVQQMVVGHALLNTLMTVSDTGEAC